MIFWFLKFWEKILNYTILILNVVLSKFPTLNGANCTFQFRLWMEYNPSVLSKLSWVPSRLKWNGSKLENHISQSPIYIPSILCITIYIKFYPQVWDCPELHHRSPLQAHLCGGGPRQRPHRLQRGGHQVSKTTLKRVFNSVFLNV